MTFSWPSLQSETLSSGSPLSASQTLTIPFPPARSTSRSPGQGHGHQWGGKYPEPKLRCGPTPPSGPSVVGIKRLRERAWREARRLLGESTRGSSSASEGGVEQTIGVQCQHQNVPFPSPSVEFAVLTWVVGGGGGTGRKAEVIVSLSLELNV